MGVSKRPSASLTIARNGSAFMSRVTNILLAEGRTKADAARAQREVWGQAFAQASQLPFQALQAHRQQQRLDAQTALEMARELRLRGQEQRAQELERQAQQDINDKRQIAAAAWKTGTFDPDAGIATATGLHRADLIAEIHDTAQKLKPPPVFHPAGSVGVDPLTGQPVEGASVPEKVTYGAPTPMMIGGKRQLARTGSNNKLYDMQGQEISADVAPDQPPMTPYQGKELEMQGATRTETARHNRAMEDRPDSGIGGLYRDIDPKAIAAQIRAAQQPPDISQYGRPASAAIASELAKPGPNGERPFNLSSAQREWKAQLNLNRTMNGGQQVRLDESIRSGLAMYDRIDAIADQWNGNGWGILSRANLEAARQGVKGPDAQSLANQLTGQIGQLTSDVATIEQGGLTPTAEARHVAEQSLRDWWSTGTIKDMTAQGRVNMQIRHLARQTQETMTPGNAPSTAPAIPAMPVTATAPVKEGDTKPIPGFPGTEQTYRHGKWIRTK
jgi:hypothetical protein